MHRMRMMFTAMALLLATAFAATSAPATHGHNDQPLAVAATAATAAPAMLAGDLAMPAITTTRQTAQIATQSFDVVFRTSNLERVPEVAWRPAHAALALSADVLGRHRT